MGKPSGSNKEMFESTRQKFIDKAHDRFVEQGFIATSTNQIVNDAGMARGALYHHFKNKEEIFAAVEQQKIIEATSKIEKYIKKLERQEGYAPAEGLIQCLEYIIDLFKDTSYRRILALESLIATPHAQRLQSGRVYGHPIFLHFFERLGLTEKIDEQNIEILIQGLIGFVSECVRCFEYANNKKELKQQAEKTKSVLRMFVKPFLEQI